MVNALGTLPRILCDTLISVFPKFSPVKYTLAASSTWWINFWWLIVSWLSPNSTIFVIISASLASRMNGEEVHLCIGGVRSLNEENLYARKSPEKFKIFIGWRVRVCSNLMLTNDGLTGRLEVMSDADIYSSALRLFQDFNPEQNLRLLENLGRTRISQEQFCQIIGRLRLYQALPASQLKELPKVILGDSNVNAATKGYIENPNFGLCGRENITCWDLMQLLNDAAKQSYIDKFLERNQNCTDFAIGIQKALRGEDTQNYGWFLS